MNPCPESERFQDLLDGELEPGEALSIREHAAACESCGRELEIYRLLYHSLERVPEWDPGPAFTARVMERVLPSRVRRRWLRAIGVGYASLSGATVAAAVVLATQPATRELVLTLSAVASRRVAQAMIFTLNALSFSALSVAGGEQWLAETGRRLAPIGRAFTALFSQTDILVPVTIAVAACGVLLWWMRPRDAESRKGIRHVGVLGF